MKKFLMILILSLGFTTVLLAQEAPGPKDKKEQYLKELKLLEAKSPLDAKDVARVEKLKKKLGDAVPKEEPSVVKGVVSVKPGGEGECNTGKCGDIYQGAGPKETITTQTQATDKTEVKSH